MFLKKKPEIKLVEIKKTQTGETVSFIDVERIKTYDKVLRKQIALTLRAAAQEFDKENVDA